MIIDFEHMDYKEFPNFNGGEGSAWFKILKDNENKIVMGMLHPGETVGLHTHEGSSEIIYIIKGCADYIYDDTTEKAPAGSVHYCPMGHSHSLRNLSDEDLYFFAVVPQH